MASKVAFKPGKFLFIFAHPDDETIGAGGTVIKLKQAGHLIRVVSVTDGGAGEISQAAALKVRELGGLGQLRRQELAQAGQILGVDDISILDFADGQITNEQVWGKLLRSLINEIDHYQPDVVVTFDHSGWYFHLDHVGVSIATTLAVTQSAHRPELFFHNHFRVDSSKWPYVYSQDLPATHQVEISSVIATKFQAMDAHLSQDLNTPRNHMSARTNQFEFFQLIFSTSIGQSWLKNQSVFTSI